MYEDRCLLDASSASNSRNRSREYLYYNLRVFDQETNKVAGYINDISLEGARLMTESPVCQGELRRFRVVLPRRSLDDYRFRLERTLKLEAISTWTTDEERTSFYDSGFRFVNMDSSTKALLSELINDFHR